MDTRVIRTRDYGERWEEAPTLEAALSAGPQESTRREFAALEAISTAVAGGKVAGLAAVAPVGYLAAANAVVTERLDAVPLRSRLGSLPGAERRHAEVLRRAGAWLRLYHEQAAGARPGRLDGCALAAEREGLAARPGAAGAALQRRLASAAARFRERDGVAAVVGPAHGDFNLANVLVTPDGRVAGLDPNLVPGPVLEDAAKFLTDLRLRRVRLVTRGRLGRRALAVGEAAFLEGYGVADRDLLASLRAAAVLRRWVEIEERLAGMPVLVRRPAAALVRSYLAGESSSAG